MAKPHKQAGRAVRLASKLPADQLAAICKQAADECKLQLDEAAAGRLAFSVRGSLARFQVMGVEVQLSNGGDGTQVMTSRIRSYKTRQQKLLGLLPLEPRRLLGISTYERFMQRFGELTVAADPAATVAISG